MAVSKKRGLYAKDIMVTKLKVVRPDDRVYGSVKMLIKQKISGAPVVDGRRNLIGMLSEKDCIQAMLRAVHDRIPPARVSDVMNRSPITVSEDTDLLTMAHLFLKHPIRRLPVVRGTLLVGQISRRDLLKSAVGVFERAGGRDAAALYLSALTGSRKPS